MSDEAKVMRISILVVVFAVVCWIAFVFIYLNARYLYMESFEQYSPASCPNTLWTCTDGDIYFASDENGKTWGAAKTDGKVACFKIFFIYREGKGFDVSELGSLSNPNMYKNFCFRGDASYSEDSCTIVYLAGDDKEHYFGEREGEVTLTFIKSDLSAPFSFDSEECLNELPFR